MIGWRCSSVSADCCYLGRLFNLAKAIGWPDIVSHCCFVSFACPILSFKEEKKEKEKKRKEAEIMWKIRYLYVLLSECEGLWSKSDEGQLLVVLGLFALGGWGSLPYLRYFT